MESPLTWWRLFRRCADFCNRVTAYADRLAAIAACASRRT
jgi:hypothetical protein